MSKNIIEINDLNYSYDNGTCVLKDVNLAIEKGESCCILGPNGGGKTTLLKLLLGFIKPDSGSIKILGEPVVNIRHKIGYMPQVQHVDSDFPVTVLEVVMFGTLNRTAGSFFSRSKRDTAMEMLEKMNIGHLAGRIFSDISGGEKQRVLIARSLAAEPEILLLDEPTANIDPGAEEKFYETLEELRKKMTVITVSHDLGFVNRETDMIICVNRSVNIHRATDFTAETANEVYHHHVNLIKHDHACFCHCQKEHEHHE